MAVVLGALGASALRCAETPEYEGDEEGRLGARDGAFSLVPAAGWERVDPELLRTGPGNADVFLMNLGSSAGRATMDATHGDLPAGITLEQHRASVDAVAGIGVSSTPLRFLVDGHEAIGWGATRQAGREVVETFSVSVMVGTRVYDFRLRSGADGFEEARADFEAMVRSVRF